MEDSSAKVQEYVFEGFERIDCSMCLVMCKDLPGFTLVGKNWAEVEAKLEEAVSDFLRFDGRIVHRVELAEPTHSPIPNFLPTSFRATAAYSEVHAA